uniref:hypothetical protein n=1 Tax=Proteus mirabilis TaxID=584 RepID=UPI0019537E1F
PLTVSPPLSPLRVTARAPSLLVCVTGEIVCADADGAVAFCWIGNHEMDEVQGSGCAESGPMVR